MWLEEIRWDLIPPGSRVLCALSGGADSMYLLCRLMEDGGMYGLTVCAAHLNHSLRPTASRDEMFVRCWCEEKGIPLTVGRCDVAGQAKAWGKGVEETARECRYTFLRQAAADMGCDVIVTAHHALDNAETVLMNLMRGCGLRGLTGIPERRGNIIRPMLGVKRGDIDQYLAGHGIPHVEDETNGDLSLLRNRVRRQLIPLMEEMNPQAVRHIGEMVSRLKFDERFLSSQAEDLVDAYICQGENISIEAEPLAVVPVAIGVRAADILLQRAGLGRDSSQLRRIYHMAKGIFYKRGRIDETHVPGGVVRCENTRLVFARGGEPSPLPEVPLSRGEQRWGEWRIACAPAVCPGEPGTPESFYLKEGRYTIRPRRAGDGLRPPNRVFKTVKKWLMEQKVPRPQRERVPVLALDGRAAALGGVGVDGGFLAAPGEPCLHITWGKDREI